MKKLLFVSLLAFVLLTLAACTGSSPNPESTPIPEAAPLETEEGPSLEGPAEVDIIGTWVFTSAQLANGTPWSFDADVTIWLEITQDFAQLHWENDWGHQITQAVVTQADDNQFLLSEKLSTFNGEEDPARPVDSRLQYNLATGLLRHEGRFYVNEGLDAVYLYFARG